MQHGKHFGVLQCYWLYGCMQEKRRVKKLAGLREGDSQPGTNFGARLCNEYRTYVHTPKLPHKPTRQLTHGPQDVRTNIVYKPQTRCEHDRTREKLNFAAGVQLSRLILSGTGKLSANAPLRHYILILLLCHQCT